LIPGLSVSIKDYGKQLTKDGKDGVRFELLSIRGADEIPLRYESEGIKKIISILNILMGMYNNPSICVAVDELDAGIYEYLLGELLTVIEETGLGQLIFTSHNLRPLEMIDKNSLIFSTTNPDNRYIKLSNVKANNNLRDFYLRSINLGGQKEEIYVPTKECDIRRALRKAGVSGNA
jgi:AAA15 family ATPase/GTPase